MKDFKFRRFYRFQFQAKYLVIANKFVTFTAIKFYLQENKFDLNIRLTV